MAAALQASLATRGPEERGPPPDRGPQKPRERVDPEEMRNARGTAKLPSEAQGDD